MCQHQGIGEEFYKVWWYVTAKDILPFAFAHTSSVIGWQLGIPRINNRETDRQTDRARDRQTDIQVETETETDRQTETETKTDRQTETRSTA